MTRGRPTTAKIRAICPDCGREVGATKDFVRFDARREHQWRLGLHANARTGEKRCTGSRMIVPVEVTYAAAS